MRTLEIWFQRLRRIFERIVQQFRKSAPGSPEDLELPPPRQAVQDIAVGSEFATLGLSPPVLQGLHEAGLVRCTVIQDKTLPQSLEGKDVAAQAQTGSGKTAAFLITLFERLLRDAKSKPSAPRALVVAPTRELALQIYRDAQLLGKYTPFHFTVIYGGVSYQTQRQELSAGADVIIATPGRLIDYIKQGQLKLDHIAVLVIDEADRMFDMGFISDLRYILRRLPPYHKRQSMLFSATLSPRVLELTYEYLNMPEEISARADTVVVETVEQQLFHVARGDKLALLLGLLQREQWQRILIFANTKSMAAKLAEKLTGNGYSAKALTGDLNQKQRTRVLTQFKQGRLPILVATDVASRGIHVEGISHVINYDLPQDREDYVHRIGRTARAGMAGKAISLASEEDVYFLESIEEFIGQKIPVIWAEDDWFIADKSREMTPVQARIARMPKAASGRRRSRPPAKEGQPSGPRKRNTGPKAGATGQKPKDSRRFRQH